MMSPRRYLGVFFVTLLIAASAVTAFNYAVDPYLVFGSARVDGFNAIKVDVNSRVRTAKVYQPESGVWDTLIAGNSRVEMGIDPDHRCFAAAGWHVYNVGIPGAGVRQQIAYALNIAYQQPVERVFLSVDFVDFLVGAGTPPPERGSSRTGAGSLRFLFDGSENPDRSWASLRDRYTALLSLDALVSSIRTVLLQSPGQPTRDGSGFNPANDFARAVELEGPAALFRQKLATLEARYAQPYGLRYSDGSASEEFEALAQFLDIAAAEDIEVTIFTNPFHEAFWALLERIGLRDLHAEWLLMIEDTLRASAADVAFWEFSMDSPFIHEAVPPPGARSGPLAWFWEPAHYRRELGDLMVETMLSDQCGTERRFGRKRL
jgi:hypothetical protein